MRLSLQTFCLVFGVTLVHLLFIAALSPVETGGKDADARLSDVPDEGTEMEEPESEVPVVERRRREEVSVDFFDQPALRREEVALPSQEPDAASES